MKLGIVNMAYFKVRTCLPVYLFVNSSFDVMTENAVHFNVQSITWKEDEQLKTDLTYVSEPHLSGFFKKSSRS